MRGICATAALMVALPWSAARAEAPKAEAAKAVETAIRNALNGAGPGIDACVERYLVEVPAADGKATLDFTVAKTGLVEKCVIDAPLENARSLRDCLERTGKGIKFPTPGEGGATLKVSAVVKKGAKFRIPAPDEKPPTDEGQKDEGFVQFFPTGWVTPQ